AEVLSVQYVLRADELAVKVRQREARRQHGVLDVEEPVVLSREAARLREPGLGPRVRRVDGHVDDLWDLERPFPDDGGPALVPVGIGDDVDRHDQPELARELERALVVPPVDALADALQPLLVRRLDAEEHVAEAELSPPREDLPVAEQHVGSGLEVVTLLDPAALDLVRDRHAVLAPDERHVVDDEDVRLADGGEVLDRRLRREDAVAPPVERPRAAERAVPGAPARELDRGARIELADEVLPAAAREMPGRLESREVGDEERGRPGTVARHDA